MPECPNLKNDWLNLLIALKSCTILNKFTTHACPKRRRLLLIFEYKGNTDAWN